MFKLTLTALAMVALMTQPAFAAKQKRQKHQWVQQDEQDAIEQAYTKKDGEICYKQVIMVTGKGRVTDGWAKGNAEKLWRSTVKGIHGERFMDLSRAKDVERVKLPASLGTERYVIKGRPCAVSF